jgi:hypothetical protein
MSNESKLLLVGDNPFHGISHFSQERSRKRDADIQDFKHAAGLVTTALENGADGFMFSVSDTTLSILKEIRDARQDIRFPLYAIVPYAYEYVRLATKVGGIPGLAKQMAKQVVRSMNLRAMGMGVKGVVAFDPAALMKTYLYYEISRIRSAAGKHANIASIMLHEIITEMALAFDLDWFFKSYIKFMLKIGIKPGFETRNFSYLVEKFEAWNIDFREVSLVSAFNKMGFQMNPSKIVCEAALERSSGAEVIAMSILASGYLKPPEAADYIRTLPNITGVVVGVSKERHAVETFRVLRNVLNANASVSTF